MNSNALNNPVEDDFKMESEVRPSEELLSNKDQLIFPIDDVNQKFAGIVSGVRMNLKIQNEYLEISQLWKSPALALAIMSFLTAFVLLFIGGILNYNDIGPTIPLFYDSVSKQFIPVDKSLIFITAILIAVIESIIIRFTFLISTMDRRLSITMAWILFFLNILILASISQFYRIII